LKIGLIYTSTTPELVELVEWEVIAQLGPDVELLSMQDPSILEEIRRAGYVTAAAAARLVKIYMNAVCQGVSAILNICSSVGEVADACQDLSRYIGVPIVRIDEEMCRAAVRAGRRVAVMATLPTTLNPTKNTLLRVAREMGRQVELVDVLVDGAFGLDQGHFKLRMARAAADISDRVDIILLAQGSMACCEGEIACLCGRPVFSSPRFGALDLKRALVGKGILPDN